MKEFIKIPNYYLDTGRKSTFRTVHTKKMYLLFVYTSNDHQKVIVKRISDNKEIFNETEHDKSKFIKHTKEAIRSHVFGEPIKKDNNFIVKRIRFYNDIDLTGLNLNKTINRLLNLYVNNVEKVEAILEKEGI